MANLNGERENVASIIESIRPEKKLELKVCTQYLILNFCFHCYFLNYDYCYFTSNCFY